jgi:hypothetical protein
MKKPSHRRPPPPNALRNLNHAPPVSRRQFLGRGLLSTSATVVGMSSFFSLFANPRKAYATLASDIQALVTSPCNIRAGAGKVPFIAFDLAGGGNIAGSNALVGGAGGQLDFLTTAGYNKLGLPGNMIPNSSVGPGNFVNQSLGSRCTATAPTCAVSRRVLRRPRWQHQWRGHSGDQPNRYRPESAQSDVRHSFLWCGRGSAGADRHRSHRLGWQLDGACLHDRSDRQSYCGHAALGRHRLVNTGSLVGLLDQADAVNVLESVERISAAKLGQVSTGLPSAQDTAIKNLVQCSYVDAAYLVDKYGNALAALDPTRTRISRAAAAFSRPRICRIRISWPPLR